MNLVSILNIVQQSKNKHPQNPLTTTTTITIGMKYSNGFFLALFTVHKIIIELNATFQEKKNCSKDWKYEHTYRHQNLHLWSSKCFYIKYSELLVKCAKSLY